MLFGSPTSSTLASAIVAGSLFSTLLFHFFFLSGIHSTGRISREREKTGRRRRREREKKRERRERVAAKMSRDGERRKKGKKRGRKNEGGDGKEVRGRGGYKDKYQRYDEDQRGGAGAAERVQLVSDDMQQYVSLEGGGGERKKNLQQPTGAPLLSFYPFLSH